MLEITLTCPACDTQNNVPVEDGASDFACVECGAVSPITASIGVATRFAPDPRIGQVISGFEIVEKVGEGGFGSVYKAIDSTLQRSVALKLLKRELTDKPEFVHKFLREAITAAKLNHPHIVAIHKFGQEYVGGEDIHFLIMEFLEGQTLSDLIEKKGPLPIEEAISIALQAADALANAHEKDVIHRDIKPENLMIDSRGNVKITDFGLAKVMSTTMQTTKVVGTPHYMSPEQFEGKAVDGRTDIYSLGVTFYYILTRAKPYEGENTVQIIYAILTNDPKPPMEVNPGVSEDLWAIIKKMIEKDPATRYQGFREVQRDLEAYRDRSLRATVECPMCGAENPQGRFCRECGAPLVIVCPLCSSEEQAGTRHCGQCGSNIALALSVREASTRADQARSRGELRQALKLYEEILDLEPGNPEAERATAELRAEVEKIDGLRSAAEDMVSRGNLAEALESVDAALQHGPAAELETLRTDLQTKVTGKAVAAHRLLADEALANHDYGTAVDALKKAVELDVDDPEIQLELREAEKNQSTLAESLDVARTEFDAQRYDLAFAASKKALDLAPEHEVAKDINERARGFIASADTLVARGRAHLAEGRYEDALDAFESAVDLRPDEPEVRQLVQEANEKIAAFERRLAEAQSLVDASEHSQATGVIESLAQERPFDDRLETVRGALNEAAEESRRTRQIKGLLTTGRAAEKAGRLEEAEEAYEQARALDAESERAQNLLNKVQQKLRDAENLVRLADEHERDGNLAQARASLSRLLEIRPGDPRVERRLASIEEGKRALDRAVEKAEAALEKRRLNEAERFADEALRVSPSHQRAEKVRTEVARLRSRIESNLLEARHRIASEMFDEALSHVREAEACDDYASEIEEIREQAEKGRVGVLKSNATRSFRFADFEGAVTAYEEILKVEPQDPEALAGRKAAIRKQRALRRESPMIKLAASILLLIGLGGVQLLAVSRSLEASEGEGGETVVVRPPVKEAVDVEQEPRLAWEGSKLDQADFQLLVQHQEWGRLEDLAREEEESFAGDPAVVETLAWARGMRRISGLAATTERIDRLEALPLPKAGPLAEIAPGERDRMLRELRASLIDRDQWQRLAMEGDLGVLVASIRQAEEHGADDESGGLAAAIEFVVRLQEAAAAAATEDPVAAIQLVYGVDAPKGGPLRAAGPEILDARAKEIIEGAFDRAWEMERTEPVKANELYRNLANVLTEENASAEFVSRAGAGEDYVLCMVDGTRELERATAAGGFRRADEALQAALANSALDPDRREVREASAREQIEAVVKGLETHTAKSWPRNDAEWKIRSDEKLREVFDLFALYQKIIRRERKLSTEDEAHEEAHRRLDELSSEEESR